MSRYKDIARRILESVRNEPGAWSCQKIPDLDEHIWRHRTLPVMVIFYADHYGSWSPEVFVSRIKIQFGCIEEHKIRRTFYKEARRRTRAKEQKAIERFMAVGHDEELRAFERFAEEDLRAFDQKIERECQVSNLPSHK